jgi:HAE1 family hydrophobic/amphiphilic exporter-1
VRIDRQLAGAMGVDSRIVMGTLQYALRGQSLPPFRPRDRETRMILEYSEDYTEGMSSLRNVPVFLPRSNTMVPLATILSEIEGGKGLGNIQRTDGMSSLAVAATLQGDDLESIRRKVDQALDGLDLPRGYEWSKGGRFMAWQQDFTSLILALILSGACVFILMAVLFESLVMPLSIFISVVLAFPGVVLALWLWDTALDNVVMFGCIVLVGIVVNNAIVLVDRIRRLRVAGMERREAIIQAGRDRFRPILMTAITTIFGLIPMAFGESGTGIPYAPLGKTVMGGMITSTLLTLYAVPTLYLVFDDLSIWMRRVVSGLFGLDPREEAAV